MLAISGLYQAKTSLRPFAKKENPSFRNKLINGTKTKKKKNEKKKKKEEE